jgi:hypothetical protein
MQDPIRRFDEREYDDTGIRSGCFDDSRVTPPGSANRASAGSEASSRVDILRRIADYEAICRFKLVFDCRALVARENTPGQLHRQHRAEEQVKTS